MATLRPILITTIPHTGTRFMIHLLQPFFGEAVKLEYKNFYVQHRLATCHTENEQMLHDYIGMFNPIVITTLREMDKVRESYIKRNVHDGRLDNHFITWVRMMDKYDPLVVAVDSIYREEQLAVLSHRLGIKLETEWTPVR